MRTACAHQSPVLRCGQEVGEDAGRVVRIGRAQLHPASPLHAVRADAIGEAVQILAGCRRHGRRRAARCWISMSGCGIGRIAAEQRHRLQVVAGCRTAMQHEPLQAHRRHPVGPQMAGDGERLVHSYFMYAQGWSCRFRPTPGRSTATSMPWRRSSSAGPIPDSISSCGELKVPPARMTSRAARACRSRAACIARRRRRGCPGAEAGAPARRFR